MNMSQENMFSSEEFIRMTEYWKNLFLFEDGYYLICFDCGIMVWKRRRTFWTLKFKLLLVGIQKVRMANSGPLPCLGIIQKTLFKPVKSKSPSVILIINICIVSPDLFNNLNAQKITIMLNTVEAVEAASNRSSIWRCNFF